MAGSYLPASQRDRAQVWLDGPSRDMADKCAALLTLEAGGKRTTRVAAVRLALTELLARLEGSPRGNDRH